MKFVSPLFGNVEVKYINDLFRGYINIIRIEGKQPIEVTSYRGNCYLTSTYNQLKFKISWKRFLSKLQYSHDIDFKRRLFTLVGELRQKDKISEQKALQRFYNGPQEWVGLHLPTVVAQPATLIQLLWKFFFPKWYNKKNIKRFPRFPKLDAKQFISIKPMDNLTGLNFELSFQKTGLLTGLYGSDKQNVNYLLEQQAKQIISEYDIARAEYFKNKKEE